MLPLGHLALAYLSYVVVAGLRRRPLPARWALLPLAFGSQFPDLVDKPLAYYELLTYGRSLAHSLFTTVLLCALVWWTARRLRGRWQPGGWQDKLRVHAPLAFTVGYGSHLLGDSWKALAAGRIHDARFLLWPIFRLPDAPGDDIPPWVRLLRIYQDMNAHPQTELVVAAVLVFVGIRLGTRLLDRR